MMIINMNKDGCTLKTSSFIPVLHCPNKLIYSSSMSDKKLVNLRDYQLLFFILNSAIFIICKLFCYYYCKNVQNRHHEKYPSPKQYSLHFKKIDKKMTDNELRIALNDYYWRYIKNKKNKSIEEGDEDIVQKCNFLFKMSSKKLVKQKFQSDSIIRTSFPKLNIENIEIHSFKSSYSCDTFGGSDPQLSSYINNLNVKEMKRLFTRECIVTFKTKEIKNEIQNSIRTFLFSKKLYISRTQSRTTDLKKKWYNKAAYIYPAPEPSEIKWKNLGQTSLQKVKRRFFALIVSIIFFILSIALLITMKIFKRVFEIDYYSREKINPNFLANLSTGISIKLINFSFRRFIMKMAAVSRYETETEFIRSQIQIIGFFQFFNLSLAVPFFYIVMWYIDQYLIGKKNDIYPNIQYLMTEEKFIISDIWSILLSNLLLGPLFACLDLRSCYKIFKRWRLGNSKFTEKYNQKEANTLFEGSEFNSAIQYICYLKITLMCLFYSPIFPISLPMGVLTVILYYLSFKFRLVYFDKVPKDISCELYFEFFKWIEIIFFIWALFETYHSLYSGLPIFLVVNMCILISQIALFFFQSNIVNFVFSFRHRQVDNQQKMTYSQSRTKFETEYERCNPFTQHVAIKEYIRFLNSAKRRNYTQIC